MKIHNVFHVDLLSPYKETEAYGDLFPAIPDFLHAIDTSFDTEPNTRTVTIAEA